MCTILQHYETLPNKMDNKSSSKTFQHEPLPTSGSCTAMLSELLPMIGIVFLTVSSVLSVYRARNDPSTVAFVVFADVNLVLLFGCLRAFEKLQRDGPEEKKARLKVAIWLLATTLNMMFAWRASDMMPWFMSAVIWLMATSVGITGFYALFIYQEPKAVKETRYAELSPEEKV